MGAHRQQVVPDSGVCLLKAKIRDHGRVRRGAGQRPCGEFRPGSDRGGAAAVLSALRRPNLHRLRKQQDSGDTSIDNIVELPGTTPAPCYAINSLQLPQLFSVADIQRKLKKRGRNTKISAAFSYVTCTGRSKKSRIRKTNSKCPGILLGKMVPI